MISFWSRDIITESDMTLGMSNDCTYGRVNAVLSSWSLLRFLQLAARESGDCEKLGIEKYINQVSEHNRKPPTGMICRCWQRAVLM